MLAIASKSISASNGATVNIYHFNGQDFVMLTDIAKSLGYNAFQSDNSILAVTLKNRSFAVCRKRVTATGKPAYLIPTEQCIPFLESFIRLTLITKQLNPMILAKMDNARARAYELIELFASEGYGKANTCPVVKTETPKTELSPTEIVAQAFGIGTACEEATQMKDNTTIQTTVPVFTSADIEDISERAEATVKVFGVSRVDALRAVTQLKAQEINRDLQPLLELLDGQKK